MSKSVFLILILAAVSMISACGGSETTNSNANANANLPAEFQGPVTPSGNTTPGIPDQTSVNMNVNNPKGTPTPGIPAPENINKVPRGTTPTPGIPDEKTIREQMKKLYGNANATPANNSKPKTVRKP